MTQPKAAGCLDLKGLAGSLNLKGLVLVRSETQSLISNYLIRVKFPP